MRYGMGDVQTRGARMARVDLHPDGLHAAWIAVPGGRLVPALVGTVAQVRQAAWRWLHPEWKGRR